MIGMSEKSPSPRKISDRTVDLLMPAKLPRPPGFEVLTYLDYGQQVLSFSWDFFELDASTLAFAMFEAVPVDRANAVVLGAARGFMHAQVFRSPTPVKVLGAMNKFVFEVWGKEVRLHAAYFLLDLTRSSVAACTCGGLPVALYGAGQRKVRSLSQGQPPLGELDPRKFRETVKEFSFSLSKNDWMAVFNRFAEHKNLMTLLEQLSRMRMMLTYQKVLASIVAIRKNLPPERPKYPLGFLGLSQERDEMTARSLNESDFMRKCRFCEHLNPSYTDVCTVCNGPLQDLAPELDVRSDEWICPKCKGVVRKGAKQCPKCMVAFCTICLQALPGANGKLCDGCFAMHSDFFGS